MGLVWYVSSMFLCLFFRRWTDGRTDVQVDRLGDDVEDTCSRMNRQPRVLGYTKSDGMVE